MRIISIKRGFTADHSSTSYQFLAVDKPLNKEEIEEVRSLSSRARPNSRKVSFNHNIDGYGTPRGRTNLLKNYYDVMYCEDYDFYNLSIALNVDEKQKMQIYRYEFDGEDENGFETGIDVEEYGKRVIITIRCQINEDYLYRGISIDNDKMNTDDDLLNLLTKLREMVKQNNYDGLYAVVKKFGTDDDLECVDKPKDENSDIINIMTKLIKD